MALGYLLLLADQLLELLGRLAFKEFKLVPKRELSDLEHNVSFVQAILREVIHWVRIDDFESLLASLEDPLSRTIYLVSELSAAKKVPTAPSNRFHEDNLCCEFREVKETLHEIVKKIRNHHETFRHSHVVDEEEVMVGRNNDKREIMKLMQQTETEEENVRLIPVFGVPRIGKTTFARNLYKADQIQQNFDLRLWVFMGDDCNTRKVVMRLLEGAGVLARNLPMDRLQKQLQRTISRKRCFVVMDNMVEDDLLDRHKLKDLFKGCARGSCVLQLLTTSSEKQVANIITRAGSADQSYCLDCLTEQDSWVLFKRQTFKDISEVEVQEREEIGRDIAAKCEGVPLSLHVISTILHYGFDDLHSWRKFTNAEKIDEQVRSYKDLLNGIRVENGKWRRPIHSFVPQDVVVGRDAEKQAIIEQLL